MATTATIKLKGINKNGEQYYLLVKKIMVKEWPLEKRAWLSFVPNDPEEGESIEIPNEVDKQIRWE